MAYVYKFELDESKLELVFDETPENALVALYGMLKRKEDEGEWEDVVYIRTRLRRTWVDDEDSLDDLKYIVQRCLAHYYSIYSDDMDGLTSWLDEHEFDEANLSVWPWPPEE